MAEGKRPTVLVVDDEVVNIQLLTEILQPLYTILAVKNGEKALEIAAKSAPDLILLDVMMPGMDGFEVCRRLKGDPVLQGIPVIFVTALNDRVDEVQGFAAGCVDYIVKPVSPPIVLARVATHLRLKATELQLRATLQETLSGAVSLLTDLLSLSNPVAYNRATKLSSYVKLMAPYLEEQSNLWQFELAAMFSQVGCLTIAPEILERVYAGREVSAEDMEVFNQHPQTGSQYVARIPQLENVARIIAGSGFAEELPPATDAADAEVVALGRRIFEIVIAYDQLTDMGLSPDMALGQLLKDEQQRYDRQLLEALEKGLQVNVLIMQPRKVSAMMLKPGYVLQEDVISTSGKLLLAAGTELSVPMVQALQRTASVGNLDQIMEVLATD